MKQVRKAVKNGGLVSDDVVLSIIKAKVQEPESVNGVLLDGFPRTKEQLIKYQREFPIHCVLNFTLRNDFLLQKLLGRRTC